MIMSRLTALALATLLSSAAFAATTASGTGPTDPVEKPKSPAIQSAPGINTNGTGRRQQPASVHGHRPADPGKRRGPSRWNEHARHPDTR